MPHPTPKPASKPMSPELKTLIKQAFHDPRVSFDDWWQWYLQENKSELESRANLTNQSAKAEGA